MIQRYGHATLTSAGAGTAYARHRPEDTVLYKTLQAHWQTFLCELESAADPPVLPAFVVSEVKAFLRCGMLANGLILVKCRDCGWCRAVAFSCQRRGFCPSCIGRRMCDFAARLADRVIPRVPVRQWVLTVPHGLRAKLAFDPALTTVVLCQFIAAVSSWLRRRARRLGIRGAIKTGAVTVSQRFNSALDISVHFHAYTTNRSSIPHPRPPTVTSPASLPRCFAGSNASSSNARSPPRRRALPTARPSCPTGSARGRTPRGSAQTTPARWNDGLLVYAA